MRSYAATLNPSPHISSNMLTGGCPEPVGPVSSEDLWMSVLHNLDGLGVLYRSLLTITVPKFLSFVEFER